MLLEKEYKMVEISTFVIFDIETTGLPRYERNRTKITELTFLAVHRRDIETAEYGHIPLINKLSFLFNPQRNIMPEVRELTGLSNEVLKNQLIFKNRIPSIISFLEELPKPVCLVAHNGKSFDFKLLQSEFIDAGAVLPKDLLCVDSLWGFKKILKETNLCHKTLATAINLSKPDDDLLTDDEDWPDFNTTAEELAEIDKLVENFSQISCENNNTNKPEQIKHNTARVHIDKTEAVQNLFEKKPKTDNSSSCTLQALYKRLLNKDAVNAHRSEADCVMLLECIVALKDHFIAYAHKKCVLISTVKPYERY